MAQGTRGRLALLGTGLLACIGCMEPDPKPISKPPVAKSHMGSTVKPNQPGGTGSTYSGGAVTPASFNTPGRPIPNTNSMAPAVPGPIGTGNSMAPPTNVFPPTVPTGYTGSAIPKAPTQPPTGFDAVPPIAPGSPSNAYPAPPMVTGGAYFPPNSQ